MNPSASGWIKKHLPVFEKEIIGRAYSANEFYDELKKTGFIYANSLSTISYPNGTTYKLNLEELSKINLLDSLGFRYFETFPDGTIQEFLVQVTAFYEYLKKNSWFNFRLPFIRPSLETKFEKIIESRIQTNQRFFKKNLSTLITNALLYLDVLTFQHYLRTNGNPIDFATGLEALLANTVYVAFKQKSDKNTHEELVLKLLETSIRYNQIKDVSLPYEELNYSQYQSPLECQYILDLACMTVYSDEIVEDKERQFIHNLGENIGFNTAEIEKRIRDIKTFIGANKDRITYLDYSSPFKNLYDNTTNMVRNLILRNKIRLIKEIRQSGELVRLLQKSTSADLTPAERTKVKNQLLDICKIIPSLAIFLLPGGSILLPLLIKFIPELLPSAFDDNR